MVLASGLSLIFYEKAGYVHLVLRELINMIVFSVNTMLHVEVTVFFVLQENNVVPLIKFLSFLCVLLGFALFALRMEYQPSFTKNWLSRPLDQPIDMEPFDWGTESTTSIDAKREGNSGEYEKRIGSMCKMHHAKR